MKRAPLLLVLVAAAAAALYYGWWQPRKTTSGELVLYGNVDLRQVELAFNSSERIEAVLVQEGDRVAKGQVLARCETTRLEPQVEQMSAQAAAQRQVLARLKNGSRPEEIAQARANLESAKADLVNAKQQYARLKTLWDSTSGRAVTTHDVEVAEAAYRSGEARVVVNEKALDLALLGPRAEEVAEAEARLQAADAQLAFLRKQLSDTQLVSPVEAVVRSRIMEPGEMASPIRPVFVLSLVDPKWIRAYVTELDLPRVHPGTPAAVTVDGFPGRRYEGWIGFVSPAAEFTPKSVETPELRTSLVYEARVFVKDPSDDLRLGMPATVHLSLATAGQPGETSAPVTTVAAVSSLGRGR